MAGLATSRLRHCVRRQACRERFLKRPVRCRLSGSGAKPGGFSGTLYDGGHVLQQLRDKAFAVCISQAGLQMFLSCHSWCLARFTLPGIAL